MMRPPFVGHRRYSITHRAVQRLRELVPGRDEEDDETLRDRLDAALGEAEDGGRAIRTLDAMLGEPQTLIPVDAFAETLYAIIKEDTVVTVLPKGHGEEILARGQAMEQRVAAGHANVRGGAPPTAGHPESRAEPRRRWQKDAAPPVVLQRPGRPSTPTPPPVAAAEPAPDPSEAAVVPLPEPPEVTGPVASAIQAALETGRRRAAVKAMREVIASEDADAPLLPLWTAMAQHGLARSLTVGDLVEAVRSASASDRA